MPVDFQREEKQICVPQYSGSVNYLYGMTLAWEEMLVSVLFVVLQVDPIPGFLFPRTAVGLVQYPVWHGPEPNA